jgi:hypothetical protein
VFSKLYVNLSIDGIVGLYGRLSFALLLSCICLQTGVNAQATASSEAQSRSEIEVSGLHVVKSLSPTASKPVDFGILPAGASVRATINIENASGKDFAIAEVISGRNDLNVLTSATGIPSGGQLVATVTFEVPKTAKSPKKLTSISFKGQKPNESFFIVFQYEVAGLSSFGIENVVRSVRPGISKVVITVPVLITSPLKPSDVSIEGRGDLNGVTGKLVQDKEDFKYSFEVDVPSDGEFRRVGELVLKCDKTGVTDSLLCTITRKPNVSIYPERLMFFKVESGWMATAIIRVNKDLLDDKSEELVASAKIGKRVVSIQSKPMTKGLLRVNVLLPEDFVLSIEKGEEAPIPHLQWQVSWEGGIAEVDSPMSFP